MAEPERLCGCYCCWCSLHPIYRLGCECQCHKNRPHKSVT